MKKTRFTALLALALIFGTNIFGQEQKEKTYTITLNPRGLQLLQYLTQKTTAETVTYFEFMDMVDAQLREQMKPADTTKPETPAKKK